MVLSGIKKISELKLKDKKVFLRLDLNTPIQNGKVSDDNRIQAALPTIRYLLDNGAKVLVASHLGRPKTREDKKKFSMIPVAERLGELLEREVVLIDDLKSDLTKSFLQGMTSKQIMMLENLRFSPGETQNSEDLARYYSEFVDVYVNDAFGCSHRAHASVNALPKQVKHKGVGFLIEKEIEMLNRVTTGYESPFWAVLGGAKVSDKISVIDNLIDKVDGLIIGGAMAYTFLAAMNKPTGQSLVEKDYMSYAARLIERVEARGKNLLLPIDHVIVKDFSRPQTIGLRSLDDVLDGEIAVDIGPKTRELYAKALMQAKTIFWNGPMGAFEVPEYSEGTQAIGVAIAENSQAFSLVGGGDSVAAIKQMGLGEKMTYLSTGGGASLEFLQGGTLPGIEALRPEKTSERGES